MIGVTLLAVLVVACLFQIGAAQNFFYISEAQRGHDYLYNGSERHFNGFSIVFCSMVFGYCLRHIPAIFGN